MNEADEVIEASEEMIRGVINGFLQERLQPKLEKIEKSITKLSDEQRDELEKLQAKRQKLIDSHQPEAWIADAARRVGQIQQVTHAIKYSHPYAKGTSLHAPGSSEVGDLAAGTHTISDQLEPDVVGNAAALDVYKFLRLEVGGKTLLHRSIDGDPVLRLAFSKDAKQAESWMAAFAGITSDKKYPATHKLAKQLYWPLGQGKYHLLSPLFPTSLSQVVWDTIREDRFSEHAKAARKAHRNDDPHPNGYSEYPHMVVQKFGSTKPQNISQLNSQRYGENYLLPSCPPNWISEPIRVPLHIKSVFDRQFARRKRVRDLIDILRTFLLCVQDVNNIRIRTKRAELVNYICSELLQFAAEIHELPGGWSQHSDCRLNPEEQCWLDPWRARSDESFANLRRQSDWKDAVCQRFGNWLNARLAKGRRSLPMGEAEARAWRSTLNEELRMIHKEIDIHD